MNSVKICLALATLWVGMTQTAFARPVDCLLVVNGKTYIKEVCEFSAGKGGSFQIASKSYFATVDVSEEAKGKADAFWNAEIGSTHAQAPLGEVSRKGACWESATVKICARALSPEKTTQLDATRPTGKMINPIRANQACVQPQGNRFEIGTPLVLAGCSGEGGVSPKWFVPTGDNLLLDKHPGICIDAKPSGQTGVSKLVLEDCKRVATTWRYDQKAGDVIRSANGLCWDIPALADPKNPPFPYAVVAKTCRASKEENTGFWVE